VTGQVVADLHEQIPISDAMGITVDHADEREVALTAPLKPNLNHRSTDFRGSCAPVAILAACTRSTSASSRPAS
jgi:thioesterase domain-containing protein